MQFEDGVFSARPVGYFDNMDMRMWVNTLNKYAGKYHGPVVAVMDIREVDRMCPTILKLLAGVMTTDNLNGVAVVAGNLMASQNARVLGKISELKGVRVFSSMDDAQRYVTKHMNYNVGPAVSYSYFQLAGA
jgi:hypothetical protein